MRALVLAMLSTTAQAGEVRFEDQSAALPVSHEYTGGWEHFVGGGVAVFDCNDDRKPDFFAAGGTNPAQLFLNASAAGGELVFAQGDVGDLKGVTGAYPLDIDSDGLIDLFVLRVGANMLLRGLGDCQFEQADEAFGLPTATQWSTAFSATWEAEQTLPTLAIGNYVDRSNPEGPFEACDTNYLLRPNGTVYGPPQELDPGFCALSMLFSDWSRQGQADLRVSNDRHYYVRGGSEQMWRLAADPYLLSAADNWAEVSIWGMGIASRDISGDGRPEVMLTSMGDQLLQQQGPEGVYATVPFATGSSAHRPYLGDDGRPSTGWHAEFGDVNNDGRADLFIAKGNVDQMPSNAMKDPNNLLIQNSNGTFAETGEAAGIGSVARGRGAALADLNADGLLDLIVVNRRAPLEVYRNITPDPGTAIQITARQTGVNSYAVGAWVEVRADGVTQTQEITVGGGHVGGHLGPLHFGLGNAPNAKVRVLWPDGAVSDWVAVRPGQRLDLLRKDAQGAALVIPR